MIAFNPPVYTLDPIFVQRPTRAVLALPKGTLLGPSLSSSLAQQLPFGISDYGQPGALSQFRGASSRAEDTQIQTEGMSLNPSYGGGLDLSTLPPFLWSGGRYDWSAQSGVFNPRATSGSLQLRLWTADTERSVYAAPYSVFWMGEGSRLQSWTAAGARTDGAGVLFGMGGGQAYGPAGSTSIRLYSNPEQARSITVHVLGTSLEQVSPGSRFFPTPNARQQSTRAMTWAQSRWRFQDGLEAQFQLGFDRASTEYRDVGDPFSQLGFSWTWDQQWTIRLSPAWSIEPQQSLRLLNYSTTSLPSQIDWAQSHKIALRWQSEDARWTLRPSLGESTGGARTEPNAGIDAVYQLDESNRFQLSVQSPVRHPNTQERFFTLPLFAVPNPNLRPERMLQTGLSYSHVGGALEFDLIAQTQRRWGTHRNLATTAGNQRINGAPSWLHSASLIGRIARGWFQPELGLTASTSSVDGSANPLAYTPALTLTHSLAMFPLRGWCVRPFARLQTQAWDDFAQAYNPATVTAGIESWYQFKGFSVGLRGDHLVGGQQEWVLGYPVAERLVTLMVRGEW